MSFHDTVQRGGRPLRILTIDNGGLQAISILRVLMDVCEKLSDADGHSAKTPLRPCELFDVIGGIGTGGWLAILLGRYRLRIDQCMNVYGNIANAIDPTRERLDGTFVSGEAAAIDQDTLIGKIDSIIADQGIGQHLFDGEESERVATSSARGCHAFAVGVVKRSNPSSSQHYRLFRTYQSSPDAKHQGPDPSLCGVSMACAATAASKDFLGECLLDVDNTTYWDDSFPRTHNVSELALDEADSLFGEVPDLDFVLNISPGVVTPQDVRQLQRTASRNGALTSSSPRWHVRRIFSASRMHDLKRCAPFIQSRANSDPGKLREHKSMNRSDTSSSTSSEATEQEREHQKDIRKRLKRYRVVSSERPQLYFRLELKGHGDKPYLDDIAKPDQAMELAELFLQLPATQNVLAHIVAGADDQSRVHGQNSFAGGLLTATPRSSLTNFSNSPPARTAECRG